ncbi:VCBS repeat-containing protein, partial [Candidatus Bathyarchaeota archaeon]|nr:VCBS repeat-containing protein [Candidatus Bathyarchaeota archaeon]
MTKSRRYGRSCGAIDRNKLLGLILFVLVTGSVLLLAPFVDTATSASPSLPLKWSKVTGSGTGTTLGPLAADINGDGKIEIVVTGGPNNWTSNGSITALEGTTGRILWQKTAADIPDIGIDMHTPFDIVDLDRDGIPEIVIPTLKGVMALHGNNGSLYWRNKYAPTAANFGAIGDVDGDGYPEIFVSRGQGPDVGWDYITELSHDGSILNQAWLWHSCWGGLSLGDPSSDGRFVLLQGDRSNGYPRPYDNINDTFKGGGLGARAWDALTLTPLWNDPTVLDSSEVPMFADVDKDGILDVVTVHQLDGGYPVVYNSTDGSVLTTNGKYRKGGTGSMGFHSQPTVFDIDYDGNLEIISGRENYPLGDFNGDGIIEISTPRIWDLYDWKDDGYLPISVKEPPKLGDINGDGRMDIIAVNTTKKSIVVYTYDQD